MQTNNTEPTALKSILKQDSFTRITTWHKPIEKKTTRVSFIDKIEGKLIHTIYEVEPFEYIEEKIKIQKRQCHCALF